MIVPSFFHFEHQCGDVMNIMFVIQSLGVGGAQVQLAVTAKEMVRRGHNVRVCVFRTGGEIFDQIKGYGIAVHSIEKKKKFSLFLPAVKLVREIESHGSEVVCGFLPSANIMISAAKVARSKPKIVFGVRSSFMDIRAYGIIPRVEYWVEEQLRRAADGIIVNSEAGREFALKHGARKERMWTVFNGIDCNRFVPAPQLGKRVRATWGVATSEKLVGIVGRLDHIKDHGTFLRCAATMKSRQANLKFVCVGDGVPEYLSHLKKMSSSLGLGDHMIWISGSTRVEEVYNALDLLVSSSLGEGFSNTLAEAMACGIPCVATDVGDAALILGEFGKTVRVADPEALAAACLMTLQGHPYSALERHHWIKRKFSVECLGARTEGIFNKLVGRHSQSIPLQIS
jgi:glycosyltransferase involved in cell wall biosynthesis